MDSFEYPQPALYTRLLVMLGLYLPAPLSSFTVQNNISFNESRTVYILVAIIYCVYKLFIFHFFLFSLDFMLPCRQIVSMSYCLHNAWTAFLCCVCTGCCVAWALGVVHCWRISAVTACMWVFSIASEFQVFGHVCRWYFIVSSKFVVFMCCFHNGCSSLKAHLSACRL